MPIFEYECHNCKTINTVFQKNNKKETFWSWSRLFKGYSLKCSNCGSKKLSKIFSSFSVETSQSSADMLNNLSKMGQINFVPQNKKGPPAGGCPYAQQLKQDSNTNIDKKIDRM